MRDKHSVLLILIVLTDRIKCTLQRILKFCDTATVITAIVTWKRNDVGAEPLFSETAAKAAYAPSNDAGRALAKSYGPKNSELKFLFDSLPG